jgi:hypothetical protein
MDKRLSNRILKAFETKFLGSQKLIQSTSSMNNNTRNVKGVETLPDVLNKQRNLNQSHITQET